jgi:hypothetical protein
MSHGRIQPDGQSVVFPHPVMDGFAAEVQHSVASGKPYCPDPGMCGIGVVTLPTGQPRLVMQTKHADGTSLSVTLKAADALVLLDCLVDGMAQAQAISEAADKAVPQ